jgi:hypothetical protein
VQTAVTIDTPDMVQIPHGVGKFLDDEVACVVVSLHADDGHVVYLRLGLPQNGGCRDYYGMQKV